MLDPEKRDELTRQLYNHQVDMIEFWVANGVRESIYDFIAELQDLDHLDEDSFLEFASWTLGRDFDENGNEIQE